VTGTTYSPVKVSGGLIEDFIVGGFDILKAVQCSVFRMLWELKKRSSDQITFLGGDTQHTLPFGRPEEVRKEIRERIPIFGGGDRPEKVF